MLTRMTLEMSRLKHCYIVSIVMYDLAQCLTMQTQFVSLSHDSLRKERRTYSVSLSSPPIPSCFQFHWSSLSQRSRAIVHFSHGNIQES